MLKATIERKRHFGKPARGFVATLSDTGWEASGETKEAAESALRSALYDGQYYRHTRRYVRVSGATFCLYFAGVWTYDIVRDASPDKHGSTMLGSSNSYASALEAMLAHVSQWSPE